MPITIIIIKMNGTDLSQHLLDRAHDTGSRQNSRAFRTSSKREPELDPTILQAYEQRKINQEDEDEGEEDDKVDELQFPDRGPAIIEEEEIDGDDQDQSTENDENGMDDYKQMQPESNKKKVVFKFNSSSQKYECDNGDG